MGAGPGRSFQLVPQTLTSESIQVSEPELIILLQPYSSTCHISLTHSLPPSLPLTPSHQTGLGDLLSYADKVKAPTKHPPDTLSLSWSS